MSTCKRLAGPEAWTVAILAEGDSIVGLGVPIEDRYLITCAHVVAPALGLKAPISLPPEDAPLLRVKNVWTGQKSSGRVIWLRGEDPSCNDHLQDIAIVEIADRWNVSATWDDLLKYGPRADNKVRVYGCPSGLPGRISSGNTIGGGVGGQWWQINGPSAPPLDFTPISPGFSGGIVWDAVEDGAVGIVVAREDPGPSFLIPMSTLSEAWGLCSRRKDVGTGHPSSQDSPPSTLDYSPPTTDGKIVAERDQVFICYGESDKTAARQLATALQSRGIRVWFDEWRSPRGHSWQAAVSTAIRNVEAIALLVGPSGIAPWMNRGIRALLCRPDQPRIPLSLVLLPGSDAHLHIPDWLRAFRPIDLREGIRNEALSSLTLTLAGTAGSSSEVPKVGPRLFTLFDVPQLPGGYQPSTDYPSLRSALVSSDESPLTIFAKHTSSSSRSTGLGLTTLGIALARDNEVRRAFPDGVHWLSLPSVGRHELYARLAAAAGSTKVLRDPDQARDHLRKLFADRSSLVILDGVSTKQDLADFDIVGTNGRLLVLVPDEGIAREVSPAPRCFPAGLSSEAAERLFASTANLSVGQLPSEARDVIDACASMPLAISLAGSCLRGKPPERWRAFLELLKSAGTQLQQEQQTPSRPHDALLPAIRTSVGELPPAFLQRYLSLAVFPPETPLSESLLAAYWDRLCDTRADAHQVLEAFLDRSLAAPDGEGRIILSTALHAYICSRRTTSLKNMFDSLILSYRTKFRDGPHDGPNDGYFFQHYPRIILEGEGRRALRKLLLDARWLKAKLEALRDINAILADLAFLKVERDERLRLLKDALCSFSSDRISDCISAISLLAYSEQTESDADFHGQDLRCSDFSTRDLSSSNFDEAFLNEADLKQARISGASFKNADLSGADLSLPRGAQSVCLDGADLRGARMEGWDYIGFSRPQILRTDQSGSLLFGGHHYGGWLFDLNSERLIGKYGSDKLGYSDDRALSDDGRQLLQISCKTMVLGDVDRDRGKVVWRPDSLFQIHCPGVAWHPKRRCFMVVEMGRCWACEHSSGNLRQIGGVFGLRPEVIGQFESIDRILQDCASSPDAHSAIRRLVPGDGHTLTIRPPFWVVGGQSVAVWDEDFGRLVCHLPDVSAKLGERVDISPDTAWMSVTNAAGLTIYSTVSWKRTDSCAINCSASSHAWSSDSHHIAAIANAGFQLLTPVLA